MLEALPMAPRTGALHNRVRNRSNMLLGLLPCHHREQGLHTLLGQLIGMAID